MDGNTPCFSSGLTKREYFASTAMAQILAFYDITDMAEIAKLAFNMADAMIKESENATR